jgi:hypothetical protein
MKLDGYREQHTLDGVSVMTLASVDVPASEVLEHRLASVTLNSWKSAALGEDDEPEPALAPQRFRYRVGDGPQGRIVETDGMILGQGDASLASFLEHRYVPDESTDRTVDRLLGQLHRKEISRADWLKVMERKILSERRQRFKRRRLYESDDPSLPPFVGHGRSIHSFFDERQDAEGYYLLRSLPDEASLAIVTPFAETVNEEAIPRWRFAIMGEYDQGVGCWDGRRYRLFEQLDELPETLRRALEADGQVVVRSKEWFAPLPDLQAGFLVRVPYASEVAHLVDAGPPPRWDALRRASFLVDTRRPVPLRGRAAVSVVDEPELAAAVLARCTPRGAFVPEMPAAPVEHLALSPEGQPPRYLAGCWLR